MVGAAIKTPTASTPAACAKPRPATPQREGSANAAVGRPRSGDPHRFHRLHRLAFHRRFPGRALCSRPAPSSSWAIAQHWPMQWYLDALYMNQGHSFFAPEVGPGHMIRYQLLDQSGHEIEHGDFPSRKEHWPRLLYHRYFMLADQSRCRIRRQSNSRPLAAKIPRSIWPPITTRASQAQTVVSLAIGGQRLRGIFTPEVSR